MSTTTFTNGVTLSDADWFNDVDAVVYEWLGDGTNEPSTRAAARNNLFTGGTVTTSTPIINATQTWNDAAVTFTGFKLNITNTNSAAASLLIDLQVGGSSQLALTRTGNLTINGTITSANSQGSQLKAANGAATRCLDLADANTVNPQGFSVSYTAAAPNDSSAAHYFMYCSDNAAERMSIRADGGIRNYSANNVNLSDKAVKPVIEQYTPELLDKMSVALEKVDWGRYKYMDQTHDDWNHGPTAQGVLEAFKDVAPELVDDWDSKLKAIYTHDLVNIAIATLLHRIKKLENANS